MKSRRILAAVVSVLCLVATGCATAVETAEDAPPAQTELEKVAACLEYVLEVWPDFMGGSEQFAAQVTQLAEVEGDHQVCEDLVTSEGGVVLSSGETVEVMRRKSDFRCECMAAWVPQYFVTAGSETIVVEHPENPKDCDELCTRKD